jgi:hypothetical protein
MARNAGPAVDGLMLIVPHGSELNHRAVAANWRSRVCLSWISAYSESAPFEQ